jgi:hypothetical protein
LVIAFKTKDSAVRRLRGMIQKADGKKEITLANLRASARIKVGERTIRDALHQRDIYFRKLRSKPRLTTEDVKARFEFAKLYRLKSKGWWRKNLHMAIDLKCFAVYTHGQGRAYAAQREIRGAYRSPGEGLDAGYVTVNKSLRYNPGTKAVLIAAGVGGGQLRVWEEISGRWSGESAAHFYEGPLLTSLKKAYPTKRKFSVLEDNDPTGFKAKKGHDAKDRAGIKVFTIPKRSPDLNVLDYAVWNQINRQMRKQEEGWPAKKRETRQQYVNRLRKTAFGLTKIFIDDSIGDMQRRVRRLYEKKGWLIEEGGRSK